jgi:hypothetical protein
LVRRSSSGVVAVCGGLLSAAIVCVAVLVAGVVVVGRGADAQSSGDARAERERVRGQRAALAVQIDALEADDASIDRALRDIDENLRGQQAMAADAERAAAEAVRVSAEAKAAAEQKAAELDALRARMTQVAVDAYVNPPGDDVLDRLKADTATDAAQKQALLDTRAGQAADLVDQLRATRFEYEQQQELAERTRVEAEQRQREATQRTIELQQARALQQQFSSQLEARLNAKLAEANALAGVDRELSGVIAAEQAALAARLRSLAPPPPPPGSDPPPPPVLAPVPLATVRGITVNRSIAGQLESLLAAAAADGFVLGGGGYRDPAQQIALRRAHCGPSTYEIYFMPPFQCVPPTAIPGSSLHEQGLAIDFTWNGRSITTQSSPAFAWLAANAARFGFYNLPSEPWHWSISGS